MQIVEKTDEKCRTDLKSLSYEELQEFFKQIGQKAFRGKQVYAWMHEKLAVSFADMTDLSKELRESLEKMAVLRGCRIATVQKSEDGTKKYLMELSDGNHVESVLMKYKHGNSVCISTQVGCRMGCKFCASTVGGLVRNLAVSEMLDQIYEIQRETGERVSNVILMGIGEPLDNFQNVLKFIRMLSDEYGLHISQRNITISTCGLADRMRELAKEKLTVTLAISLHAPNDALRQTMMPVAHKFSIEEIMAAAKEYLKETGRRVTFEYSMVRGTNDSLKEADELAGLLKGMNCHVNLIPLNPVKGRFGDRSQKENIQSFKLRLEKKRINVTIRREMGRDIDAACGQLKNKQEGRKLHESMCED